MSKLKKKKKISNLNITPKKLYSRCLTQTEAQSLVNLIFRREFGDIQLNFRFGLQRGCQGKALIDADSTATFSRTSNIQHRPSDLFKQRQIFQFFTHLSIALHALFMRVVETLCSPFLLYEFVFV